MGTPSDKARMPKDLNAEIKSLTPENRQKNLDAMRKRGQLKDLTVKTIKRFPVESMSEKQINEYVYDRTNELKTVNNAFEAADMSIEPRDLSTYLKEAKYICERIGPNSDLREASAILANVKYIQDKYTNKEDLGLTLAQAFDINKNVKRIQEFDNSLTLKSAISAEKDVKYIQSKWPGLEFDDAIKTLKQCKDLQKAYQDQGSDLTLDLALNYIKISQTTETLTTNTITAPSSEISHQLEQPNSSTNFQWVDITEVSTSSTQEQKLDLTQIYTKISYKISGLRRLKGDQEECTKLINILSMMQGDMQNDEGNTLDNWQKSKKENILDNWQKFKKEEIKDPGVLFHRDLIVTDMDTIITAPLAEN